MISPMLLSPLQYAANLGQFTIHSTLAYHPTILSPDKVYSVPCLCEPIALISIQGNTSWSQRTLPTYLYHGDLFGPLQ